MPLSSYDGEQPVTGTVSVGVGNDELQEVGVGAVRLQNHAASVFLFTRNYNFVWRGQVIGFRHGVPYQLDPALLAAISAETAPDAPMVGA